MKDRYRKVRKVIRQIADGHFDRVAGRIAKKNYVLDAQGRRVNRTTGRLIAADALKAVKAEV